MRSLLSFQRVTERSRMVLTIQHHIILNTFNRQSTKTKLDSILCVSNFYLKTASERMNLTNKDYRIKKKKTGVNTPVLNWLLFSVIYLPFCSVNLTWTQQSISSNSHQNTRQSSSRCQMLLKALHGLPKTLLAEKLLESNCF